MIEYEKVCIDLKRNPKNWLVTGVAGFIGSNLLETLLLLDQHVVGLDNLSTGNIANLNEVRSGVTDDQWARFRFIEGDIRDMDICRDSVIDIDYVLHQAALGSVPRSVNDPIETNSCNISGFLNMLVASKDQNVKSFVYAASSSTYGDHPGLPKIESVIGNPLSPYAVTKFVNEAYAKVFSLTYSFDSIGLRYFNVFGKRQDPNGAYAAVIPKWVSAMINNEDVFINGDGETSRDFCYIENAIQMNILAATCKNNLKNEIYNVAFGERTTLNSLFIIIRKALKKHNLYYQANPIFEDFRQGDVRHSLADINKAKEKLLYLPQYNVHDGIDEAISWYIKTLS